jgi:uncharacterized membrane protein
MASPLTVWSSTADGRVRSQDADYAVARSTAFDAVTDVATIPIGQYSGTFYYCYEGFFSFDTSSVGAGVTVTVATLSFYCSSDYSAQDFTVEARIHDWGAALTTADWVAGASLGDKTLVASRSSTPTWATDAYSALTSESAFLTNIAQVGTTYILACSDRHRIGNTPDADYEWVYVYSADDATGGGGTDRDPKLYVEWTTAGNTQLTASAAAATSVAQTAAAQRTMRPTASACNAIAAASAATLSGGGVLASWTGIRITHHIAAA